MTHNDAAQSVGLLWTSDQLVAETSTWQHTTLATENIQAPRWDSNPRSQRVSGRKPFTCWDRWFQTHRGAWIFVCCECRVLSGRGLCDELFTRPEESYRLCCVVVCTVETSRTGAPYIYDISSLRVNHLTLTLLTWRKWWTPNKASK